jgi:hypothetical protein
MTNRVDAALRAAACERMRAVAKAEGPLSADAELSFADRLRQLYEQSVLPVREIARIAGIVDRTLFSYVQRDGWKRRNWRQVRHQVRHDGDARDTAEAYVAARRFVDVASAAAAVAAQERAARTEAVAQERVARREAAAAAAQERAARKKAAADARVRAKIAKAAAEGIRVLAHAERDGRRLPKEAGSIYESLLNVLFSQI